MKKDVFICTKPLQYFNIRNIPYETYFGNSQKKILLIVDLFQDAAIFANKVQQKDKFWDEIIFVANYNKALLYVWRHFSIKNLFLHCDTGFSVALTCFWRLFNVYTYEEGVGTYGLWGWNSPYNKIVKAFTKIGRTILGNGSYMNDSKWLKGCFLYYPSLFYELRPQSKIKVFKMKEDFVSHLKNNFEYYADLLDFDFHFFDNVVNKKVLLYITTEIPNMDVLNRVSEERNKYDYVFLKLHPHIKGVIPTENGITVLKNQVMAEILISKLISNKNQLTVYHHNSTSVLYFQNEMDTISFSPQGSYGRISEYIKKLDNKE